MPVTALEGQVGKPPRWCISETGTNSTLPPVGYELDTRAPTSSDNGLDRLPSAHIRGGQHTRASTPSAHVQNVCLQKAFCPQLFALSSTSAMIAEPVASLWKAFLSSVVRPLPLPLWERKGGRGKVRGLPSVSRPARTRRTIAQPGLHPLAVGCGPPARAPRRSYRSGMACKIFIGEHDQKLSKLTTAAVTSTSPACTGARFYILALVARAPTALRNTHRQTPHCWRLLSHPLRQLPRTQTKCQLSKGLDNLLKPLHGDGLR